MRRTPTLRDGTHIELLRSSIRRSSRFWASRKFRCQRTFATRGALCTPEPRHQSPSNPIALCKMRITKNPTSGYYERKGSDGERKGHHRAQL
jgi:hypothetical protein